MLQLGLIIALLSMPGPEWSECYEDTFCIEAEDAGNRVDVYVRSLVDWDVTLSMDMELANMQADQQLPQVHSVPSQLRFKALTLKVKDISRSWSFRYDLKWMTGDYNARHAPGVVYELPIGHGVDVLVGQGFHGTETHHGKYAIDFALPEGTPVRAAREGVVIDVVEAFKKGGVHPAMKTRANYIKIRHEDGTLAQYAHLRHLGVEVAVGDRVRTGELIGYSGNTGFSTGPHLHFEVFSLNRDLSKRTIPIKFQTARRGVIHLQEGVYYRRPSGQLTSR